MPSAYPGAIAAPKRRWSGFSALLAGLLTALLVVTGFNATPAMAANGTVDIDLPHTGENHNDIPVYVEGQTYSLTIGFKTSEIGPGHKAVIEVPKGFTIVGVPKENDAVETFTLEGGVLTIQFKDKYTQDNGAIDLEFMVDTREVSSQETVVWNVNGTPTEQTIVFKEKDDHPREVATGAGKGGDAPEFTSAKVKDGKVVLNSEDFLGKEIAYYITVNSKDAREVVIEDTLAEGMILVPGSFTLSKSVWDANGLNLKRDAVDMSDAQYEGTSFSHSLSAEQNSSYELRYRAKIVDEAALEDIRVALQASYDALKNDNGEVPEGSTFSYELKNTATINGEKYSKSFTISGKTDVAPKPNLGDAFNKGSDLKSMRPIELKEDGETLKTPLPVTYEFRADLTQFAKFDKDPKHKLKSNVVITDELPANFEWLVNDDSFIDGYKLVSGVSETDFAGDLYAGFYMVDGQKLSINVGRDTTKNHAINVKAQLLNVSGAAVHKDPAHNPYIAVNYDGMLNNAKFYYGGDKPEESSVDTSVFIEKDPSTGINDPRLFKKEADSKPIVLESGQTVAQVPFTFTVEAGVGDARKSSIVDHIDHNLLDVSEATLDQIRASITGKYDWSYPIDGSTVDVSLNKDNDLVFSPNESFPKDADWGAAQVGASGFDGHFEFTVVIPTKPISGNEAITVKNSASLTGEDHKTVFTTVTNASAGVGGREISVKKAVYNPAKDEFTTNLRAELDEKGELVTDEFIYRVQFLPTLSYTTMLYNIDDQLVDNLEFMGFVDPDKVETGETAGTGTYTIPGTGLRAIFDAAENLITVPKGDPIEGGKVTELFFKVKVKDFVEGKGVENAIGHEKVTITPTNEMPLDISKINQVNPTGEPITDRDARFELRNADGDVVVRDMFIVEGKLRVAGKNGGDAVPSVKHAGTYTVHELKAPAGFVKATEPVILVVNADGTSQETKFMNTPRSAVKQVSVGDYVWLDINRDGVQDAGERGIEGVKLVLTGPSGEAVTTIDGDPVEPTTTDDKGFYEFTDLPALEEGQTYTVSIVQDDKGTLKALEGLTPTKEDGTEDREKDSSTWTAISRDDLVNDGDRDPSLDFGFHAKQVSVGDYVWLDIDGDGVQGTDEGETPIQGVKLVLTGPDGKPVTNVFGEKVKPVVTDDKGFYEFPNLPALKDGETYTVSIDREDADTLKALEGLIPTKTEGTSDRELDSSEWTAVSRDDLVNDGDKDYSLDFGFKSKSVSVGDYVWLDVDRDGVQGTDEGETPIQGVKLVLTGPDGKPVTDVFGNEVKPVVTNDKGFYEFPNLPALKDGETYTVSIAREDEGTVQALEGLIPTTEKGTKDREKDSSTWTATSRDDLVNNGDSDYSLDFGFHSQSVSVGDYVWLDVDRDGVQGTDKGETPIQGVKLVLTGPDGKPVTNVFGEKVKPVVTNDKGFYEFPNLPALKDGETYTVSIDREDEGTVQALEGLIPTTEKGTKDREKDSSTWTATSRDDLVNNGDSDYSLDFGFHSQSVSVGDYVWLDVDRDGVQGTDKGETPIQGVKLVLTGPDGKPVTNVFGEKVKPVVTNDKGFYEFPNLPALKNGETYSVSIDQNDAGTKQALEGLVPTKTEGTSDRELDSSEWTAVSRDDLVTDGDRDSSLDFGFHSKSVSVGDYVWLDVDRDGVQGTDKGETPISGVKLVLTGPDGKPVTDVFGNEVKPVVTNDKGFYEFPNLPALKDGETYTVSIDREDEGTVKALEGLVPTKTEGTSDRELDSSEWTAVSRDDLVNNGDRDASLDFGLQPKSYAIGDVVWIDTNKDGIQDSAEKVLTGVTVELFQGGEVIATTTTDENGRYMFDELRAGEYEVKFTLTKDQQKVYQFTKQHAGDNAAVDSNADPKTGFTVAIVLGDDNANLTLDYEYGTVLATQGIDPTWDAGVIVIDIAPAVDPGTPGVNDLPKTGGSLPLTLGGIALALLAVGASLMFWRRRTA